MTAVEWLVKIYLQTNKIDSFDIEQAKEMEKQQIIQSYRDCHGLGHIYGFNGEEYYNETYGSKGSDENFKQFSLYEHKETITSADTITFSQTEISDEEIEEASAKLYTTPHGSWGFVQGAKWYREQLKKKQ